MDQLKAVVTEKFRHDEILISMFKAYQITIGDGEHENRLLVLINNVQNNTYALFSFGVNQKKWPPTAISDLYVDQVFAINQTFQLNVQLNENSISPYQFKISSGAQQITFYYNPADGYVEAPLIVLDDDPPATSNQSIIKSFEDFVADIKFAIKEFKSRSDESDLFTWLSVYSRDDLTVIHRSVAEGSAPLQIRENKFKQELAKREHEYIYLKDFRIYLATWNVNGKSPNDIVLNEWLCHLDDDEPPPDIYAIAFQELDLSPKAITFSESRPDPVWNTKIMDGLHPAAKYEMLCSVRLVGMMLTIAVRQELRKNIQHSMQTVGTGALNIMGNKGGVGVSMILNESSLCFINSHFAAHQNEVERRNENHDEIIRRLQFEHGIQRWNINEHNHIFWFGDLNYRIEYANRSAFDSFDNMDYTSLLKNDQLLIAKENHRIFQGYQEAPIKFRPTYKYDPGTSNWDSSEKCRLPAWCDRVLWKSDTTNCIEYTSIMSMMMSDHKPVIAKFTCGIKTRDDVKFKKIHEEVLKRVDKYENDNQPQISVDRTDIDFGVVEFNEVYTQDFVVANNCHLPVHFVFKEKNGRGSTICEPWFTVEPTEGQLFTGESLSIRVKLFVNSRSANRVHQKQKISDVKAVLDILVLHIKNGRDIFITLIGEYKPSCFGFDVETLTRLPQPVAELDLKELMLIENSTDSGALNRIHIQQYKLISIPRELFFLIDYLYKPIAIGTPNLFSIDRKYRNDPQIIGIRNWLNRWLIDEPFPGNPHTAAEALLMLLESSPKPLVSPLEPDCLFADTMEKSKEVIRIISETHRNCFLYICMFLQYLIQKQSLGRADITKLAILFGKAMLKNHYDDVMMVKVNLTERERDDRRTQFIMRFLVNDIKEFSKSQMVM